MLVLTRKMQERIQIGSNITITILRVKGNTVRVGIDAPREIRVVRGELTVQRGDSAEQVSEEVAVVVEQCEADGDDNSGGEEPSVPDALMISV